MTATSPDPSVQEATPQPDGSILVRIQRDPRVERVNQLLSTHGVDVLDIAESELARVFTPTATNASGYVGPSGEPTRDTDLALRMAKSLVRLAYDTAGSMVMDPIETAVIDLGNRATFLDERVRSLEVDVARGETERDGLREALLLCDASMRVLADQLAAARAVAEQGRVDGYVAEELDAELRGLGAPGARKARAARKRGEDRAQNGTNPPDA